MDISLRTMTESEQKYSYSQSQQLSMQCGAVGYLRGDFGSSGDEFFTTWNDCHTPYKTEAFSAEFDTVMESLCSDLRLFRSRDDLAEYCGAHADGALNETEFGFRVDGEKYSYLIRCNPQKGDYNFYVFPYVSEWLDRHIQKAENGIRFIDSGYNELFRIPDGGKVLLTHSDGRTDICACRYIDSTHLEFGKELYHSCQLAEVLERNGAVYAPENGTSDTYSIYQIRDVGSVDYAFRSFDEAGEKFNRSDYKLMYSGMLGKGVTLEDLWSKHNCDNRHFGREMRSMSMSDVVVLNRDGEAKAFYADRIGFSEVPQFFESNGDTVKQPKKKTERGR